MLLLLNVENTIFDSVTVDVFFFGVWCKLLLLLTLFQTKCTSRTSFICKEHKIYICEACANRQNHSIDNSFQNN